MFLDALNDAVLVQEVHLVFGGMHVHVDVVGGDLQAGVRHGGTSTETGHTHSASTASREGRSDTGVVNSSRTVYNAASGISEHASLHHHVTHLLQRQRTSPTLQCYAVEKDAPA